MNPIEDLRLRVRAEFPSLAVASDLLLDNAGGSQVPTSVGRRIADYFLQNYVQLGADYATSRAASAVVDDARSFALDLFGGRGLGQAILGASTSSLVAMLAECHGRAKHEDRDEIVISDGGHESNIGPWRRLEAHGYRVRWWRTREDGTCRLEDLQALLSPRTRVLAVHHVSNLLGRVEDVASCVDAAHQVGARVIVDGVAFAPHRAIDVAALGCDYYVFSLYKVYGPHMAALFGRDEALAELVGPNHDFIPDDAVPYKFELGGVSHEACAGLLGVRDYLAWLATDARAPLAPTTSLERRDIEAAFERMQDLEAPLTERMLEWLGQRPELRVLGPATAEASRVGTISFVTEQATSRAIALRANAARIGIRYGHFYAVRLSRALGLDPSDGVVRTSFVHYSSLEEIDALLEHWERRLA